MPTVHSSLVTAYLACGATIQSIQQLNQTRNDVRYKEVGEIAAKSEHLDRTRDGFQQFLDMNL